MWQNKWKKTAYNSSQKSQKRDRYEDGWRSFRFLDLIASPSFWFLALESNSLQVDFKVCLHSDFHSGIMCFSSLPPHVTDAHHAHQLKIEIYSTANHTQFCVCGCICVSSCVFYLFWLRSNCDSLFVAWHDSRHEHLYANSCVPAANYTLRLLNFSNSFPINFIHMARMHSSISASDQSFTDRMHSNQNENKYFDLSK